MLKWVVVVVGSSSGWVLRGPITLLRTSSDKWGKAGGGGDEKEAQRRRLTCLGGGRRGVGGGGGKIVILGPHLALT